MSVGGVRRSSRWTTSPPCSRPWPATCAGSSARATGSCARARGRRGSTSCATSSRAATRSRCWWPTSACPACRAPTSSCRRARSCPSAKRVLLTAYADTEAAIQAINEVALDYYLLKPWDPPEEQLYPVVEDLLTTWDGGRRARVGRRAPHRASLLARDARAARLPGAQPRPGPLAGRRARQREPRAADRSPGVDESGLPVALLEDGTVLERPTVLELAERLGVAVAPAGEHYDLVIVGGGPAGLAAAVYGASEGLRTVMVEREAPGGQAGQSSRIENYLGFPRGPERLGPRQPRAPTQARAPGRRAAQRAGRGRARRRGHRAPGRALGRRQPERELRARGLRRLLQPARRARLRALHGRRDLLRRGDDRGGLVHRPDRRGHRRRQLRRARPPSTSASTRAGSSCSCAPTRWPSRCRTT